MNKVFYAVGLSALLVSFSASADSILRIKCDDQDVGAEVFINTKFVGSCPLDVPVREGLVQVQARKIVNGDYEQLFEKQLRVVDGVAQKIELAMSAPQLTAEAKHKQETAATAAQQQKEIAEAAFQLRAAEAGAPSAMRKIADYYDAGMGVKQDPAKAAAWRTKAEAAAEQAQLHAEQEQLLAAQAGNIEAMLDVALRYDAGLGLQIDHAQAQYWREKADTTKHEKIAQEKAREKQEKLDRIEFFHLTTVAVNVLNPAKDPDRGPVAWTFAPTVAAISTLMALPMDLCQAPTNSTELVSIRQEAALRPSSWAKPDSMIAQASRQQTTTSATEKLIAATQ
jgi:hypothetical protein